MDWIIGTVLGIIIAGFLIFVIRTVVEFHLEIWNNRFDEEYR